MRDQEKTIGNLIDKTSGAFISYIDNEGYPITKAMLSPRKREGIKVFYFTTNTSSNKVKQYQKNPNTSIYFVDKRFYRGVCLSGTATILTDAKSKEEIWHEGDEMYYPLGVTDPDYCVLKITITKGSYYYNFKNESFEV